MPALGSAEIGFATLPQHLHRKYAKKGFDFTIMVVGEAGLGKSTLINSLFLADLYRNRKIPNVEELLDRTVQIEKKQLDIIEKGIKLKVTIVDTPGYGDSLNMENSFQAVENYVDDQYNQYFRDESGLNRKNIQDNRVHCCIFFVSSTGRGLTQLDIMFLKRLHQKVNIVPIISKADALTPNELHYLKKKVMRDLADNNINVFHIPECDSDEEEEFRKRDREIKEAMPFTVIASTLQVEVNGRKTRGRIYPWGVIDIQDEEVSDFVKLKTFLSLHMQDLKDVTNEHLYENFRAMHLAQMKSDTSREHQMREREPSMDRNADRLLQQKEEEIRHMQEQLRNMQQQVLRQQSSAPASSAQSADDLSPQSGREE